MAGRSEGPTFVTIEEAARLLERPRSWLLSALLGDILSYQKGRGGQLEVCLEEARRLRPAAVLRALGRYVETPDDWPDHLCGERRREDAARPEIIRDLTPLERGRVAVALGVPLAGAPTAGVIEQSLRPDGTRALTLRVLAAALPIRVVAVRLDDGA